MSAPSEELVAEIALRLELDHQYIATVPAWDTQRVAEVRAAGRAASRQLGWKVRTFQQHDEDQSLVRVFVVIIESNEDDDLRLRERAALLMDEASKGSSPDCGSPG